MNQRWQIEITLLKGDYLSHSYLPVYLSIYLSIYLTACTFSTSQVHLYLLSSDSFSSTLLSSNLSLLSASALLCFSSVRIVGSLTSKLPSSMLLPIHPSLSCQTVSAAGWSNDSSRSRDRTPSTSFWRQTCDQSACFSMVYKDGD